MPSKMDKKSDSSPPPPPPPPSVGDYDDSQSTYTVDQPPPAYRKPEVPAVKLAKIVAATILLVTFIIGLTSVAIVYVQQNMKCAEMLVVHQVSSESDELPDLPAKLAQRKGEDDPTSTTTKSTDEDGEKFFFPDLMGLGSEDKPKQLNFPIHIDMDELTGKMMEKNQRARLNCVIEKKRSEEIIPRAPKTLQTPFGNLTTDPKFTHVTGETMSLTCRSGNDRVSRPATASSGGRGNAGSPILIQIPLQQQRGPGRFMPPMPMRPQMMPQQMRSMQQESGLPALLGPLQALHEIQRMHQQRQQQQQQQQQMQLQEQRLRPGGMFLPPHMHIPISDQQPSNNLREQQEPEDQQLEQQRILPQLAQHFSMPLLPLPQISLHQMLPQLLEVHKQLQQERHLEEEQQQQQQRNGHGNVHEESHRDEEREEDPRRPADGRTISMHDMQMQHMHRVPPPHPPPPPPQHLQQHIEGFFGRPPQQQQQQQQQPHQQVPPQHQPQQHLEQNHGEEAPQVLEPQHMPLPHHVQQQQQQQHEAQRTPKELIDDESDEDGAAARAASNHQQQHQQPPQQQHPHQEHMGIQLEVAPSFHGPQIVPADMMMMSRAMQHPAPFLAGSHNMQPRSSARPRMKRQAMAGSCSCLCK